MKKFFSEFKKFITRGNVVDMAVGVIVGGAFTAIVNSLSNNILKPIINWVLAKLLGSNSLDGIYTYLQKVNQVDETGNVVMADGQPVVDLTKSIYIDWGSFINAIINFILIALVLFLIVRFLNRVSAAKDKASSEAKMKKAAIKKYRKDGLSYEQAIAKYEEDLKAEEEAKKLAEAKAQEEAKKAAELEKAKAEANTKLLEEIRDLLKASK